MVALCRCRADNTQTVHRSTLPDTTERVLDDNGVIQTEYTRVKSTYPHLNTARITKAKAKRSRSKVGTNEARGMRVAKDEEGMAQRWANRSRKPKSSCRYRINHRTREITRARDPVQDCGPFRFDRARNQALSHVPEDADWCFSVDLDEVFEPGWRSAIEQAAQANPLATQIKYPFVFSHRINPHTGKEEPDLLFYKGNCHRRHGWKWVCPCHEVIISDTQPIEATAEGCVLHHRSPMKQRREGYLALLEQGAKDEPNNARTCTTSAAVSQSDDTRKPETRSSALSPCRAILLAR